MWLNCIVRELLLQRLPSLKEIDFGIGAKNMQKSHAWEHMNKSGHCTAPMQEKQEVAGIVPWAGVNIKTLCIGLEQS